MTNAALNAQYVSKDLMVYRTKVSARYHRFSFEPVWSFFKEEDNNRSMLNTTLLFTFAQNQNFSFRSGMGFNYFNFDSDFHGINWRYDVSVYREPLHVNLWYDLIGYKLNGKTEYRGDFGVDLGYFMQRLEMHLGYRLQKISTEKFFGPVIGITLWL